MVLSQVDYRVREIRLLMAKEPSKANARRILTLTLALRDIFPGVPKAEELIREVGSQIDSVTAAKLIFDAEEVNDVNTVDSPGLRDGGNGIHGESGQGGSETGPRGLPGQPETRTGRPRPRFIGTGYDLV